MDRKSVWKKTEPIANVVEYLTPSQLLKNTSGQMFELLIFWFGVKSDDRTKMKKNKLFYYTNILAT